MALFVDAVGILSGIFTNVLFVLTAVVIIAFWTPVYLFLVKYPLTVVMREKVGNNTIVWYTKAGIIKVKEHGREELRILKSKMTWWRQWSYPLISNEYYHSTKKGRKFLEFYKIGDHDADLKPIKPLNSESLMIKPTDVKTYDWLSQGMLEDARQTREAPDTLAKWTIIGIPVVFISALVVMFIVGMTEINDTMAIAAAIQQDNVQIQETWNDNIRIAAGIQTIHDITEEEVDPTEGVPGVKLLSGENG